jgi:hypothetical protein
VPLRSSYRLDAAGSRRISMIRSQRSSTRGRVDMEAIDASCQSVGRKSGDVVLSDGHDTTSREHRERSLTCRALQCVINECSIACLRRKTKKKAKEEDCTFVRRDYLKTKLSTR